MKLVHKLYLSFFFIILLLISVAGLTWNSTNNLATQQQYILYTEDIISQIGEVRSLAMEAVASSKPQLLNEVKKLMDSIDEQLKFLEKNPISTRHSQLIQQVHDDLYRYSQTFEKMKTAFSIMIRSEHTLTELGTKITTEITELQKNSIDTQIQNLLKDINLHFITARLDVTNLYLTKTQERYNIVKDSISRTQNFIHSLNKSYTEFSTIFDNINSYLTESLPILDSLLDLQTSLVEGQNILTNLTNNAKELSTITRGTLFTLKDEIVRSLLIFTAIASIISLILSSFISKNVLKQLGADPSELASIADKVNNGTFSIDKNKIYTGVYKNITDMVLEQTAHTQKMIAINESMQNTANQLKKIGQATKNSLEQFTIEINNTQNGAQLQADQISNTATALEEMHATILEIAKNASTTSESARIVKNQANAGSNSMQECVFAMEQVRDESLKLQDEMKQLSTHAQAINEVMNVISDIADQTNLLALNAAIEAARAGDAGRGFAVVADEVRNLAEKTMSSTTDVDKVITSIQTATFNNTQLVMGTVKQIETVTEMLNSTGTALQDILQLIDETTDQVNAIATASEEQSATSNEITKTVEEINSIAKANVQGMQKANAELQKVNQQNNLLTNLIEELQRENI